MDDGQRASDQAGGDSVGAACGPPQLVEKVRLRRPLRNVCAQGRKPPARPAKPGDTNALWRACGPSKPPGKSLSAVWAACGPPLFCVSEKKGEKRPKTLQKEKKPIGRPTIHPSFPRGLQTKKIRQNHPETIQKKRRNAMPRMSRKRREEWDFFLSRRNRITYNDLCRNCRHDCKQSFRAQIVACRKYRSKRSETWR